MLRKQPRKDSRKPQKLIALMCVMICGYLVFCADHYMAKCVQEYADFECEQIAASAIQNAVSSAWKTSGFSPEELYTQILDQNGQIRQIAVDTNRLHILRTQITQQLEEALDAAVRQQPNVHLTALLGSCFFSQTGPSIRMKIYPQPFSRVQLQPSIQNAGINQTRFSIELTFEVNLSTSILNYRSRAESNITVPLVELLIMGNIPSYYAG